MLQQLRCCSQNIRHHQQPPRQQHASAGAPAEEQAAAVVYVPPEQGYHALPRCPQGNFNDLASLLLLLCLSWRRSRAQLGFPLRFTFFFFFAALTSNPPAVMARTNSPAPAKQGFRVVGSNTWPFFLSWCIVLLNFSFVGCASPMPRLRQSLRPRPTRFCDATGACTHMCKDTATKQRENLRTRDGTTPC